MSLSIGIVGLPNVGKSTLFQAITKKEVEIANYPFATIDPNVGVVAVPDRRLDKLAEFSKSEKKIPAIVEFIDIAGLVKGANKGEGLGNQFLANIREVDAVLYVVRAFEDPEIHHVEARVNPKDDVEILTTELILKDLETVNNHLEKVRKDAKGGNKDAILELPLLEAIREKLDGGDMAYKILEEPKTDAEKSLCQRVLKTIQLLTAKPGIFLLNIKKKDEVSDEVRSYLESFKFPILEMNVREELDSSGFSDDERNDLGLGKSMLPELISLAYKTLGLITFFTTGEKETRAWTIKSGMSAPQAAGVIHSDFEEKFIRTDVISWDKLLESGGWGDAKVKGIMQTVGKDYVMKDGDVIEVKHGA